MIQGKSYLIRLNNQNNTLVTGRNNKEMEFENGNRMNWLSIDLA